MDFRFVQPLLDICGIDTVHLDKKESNLAEAQDP